MSGAIVCAAYDMLAFSVLSAICGTANYMIACVESAISCTTLGDAIFAVVSGAIICATLDVVSVNRAILNGAFSVTILVLAPALLEAFNACYESPRSPIVVECGDLSIEGLAARAGANSLFNTNLCAGRFKSSYPRGEYVDTTLGDHALAVDLFILEEEVAVVGIFLIGKSYVILCVLGEYKVTALGVPVFGCALEEDDCGNVVIEYLSVHSDNGVRNEYAVKINNVIKRTLCDSYGTGRNLKILSLALICKEIMIDYKVAVLIVLILGGVAKKNACACECRLRNRSYCAEIFTDVEIHNVSVAVYNVLTDMSDVVCNSNGCDGILRAVPRCCLGSFEAIHQGRTADEELGACEPPSNLGITCVHPELTLAGLSSFGVSKYGCVVTLKDSILIESTCLVACAAVGIENLNAIKVRAIVVNAVKSGASAERIIINSSNRFGNYNLTDFGKRCECKSTNVLNTILDNYLFDEVCVGTVGSIHNGCIFCRKVIPSLEQTLVVLKLSSGCCKIRNGNSLIECLSVANDEFLSNCVCKSLNSGLSCDHACMNVCNENTDRLKSCELSGKCGELCLDAAADLSCNDLIIEVLKVLCIKRSICKSCKLSLKISIICCALCCDCGNERTEILNGNYALLCKNLCGCNKRVVCGGKLESRKLICKSLKLCCAAKTYILCDLCNIVSRNDTKDFGNYGIACDLTLIIISKTCNDCDNTLKVNGLCAERNGKGTCYEVELPNYTALITKVTLVGADWVFGINSGVGVNLTGNVLVVCELHAFCYGIGVSNKFEVMIYKILSELNVALINGSGNGNCAILVYCDLCGNVVNCDRSIKTVNFGVEFVLYHIIIRYGSIGYNGFAGLVINVGIILPIRTLFNSGINALCCGTIYGRKLIEPSVVKTDINLSKLCLGSKIVDVLKRGGVNLTVGRAGVERTGLNDLKCLRNNYGNYLIRSVECGITDLNKTFVKNNALKSGLSKRAGADLLKACGSLHGNELGHTSEGGIADSLDRGRKGDVVCCIEAIERICTDMSDAIAYDDLGDLGTICIPRNINVGDSGVIEERALT